MSGAGARGSGMPLSSHANGRWAPCTMRDARCVQPAAAQPLLFFVLSPVVENVLHLLLYGLRPMESPCLLPISNPPPAQPCPRLPIINAPRSHLLSPSSPPLPPSLPHVFLSCYLQKRVLNQSPLSCPSLSCLPIRMPLPSTPSPRVPPARTWPGCTRASWCLRWVTCTASASCTAT